VTAKTLVENFKTGALNHSATLPDHRCPAIEETLGAKKSPFATALLPNAPGSACLWQRAVLRQRGSAAGSVRFTLIGPRDEKGAGKHREMNPQTADWANFFVAEVGASAALTGLLVVAISINLARILAIAQLPGRAAEGLIILVGAFVLGSVALIPDQSARAFAAGLMTNWRISFASKPIRRQSCPFAWPLNRRCGRRSK
jgi:hypothetical protein